MPSGLFGIQHSNRSEDDHWGKNCFNSSFPAATANYMMAKGIPAIYIHLEIINGKPDVMASEIPVSKVFRCKGKQAEDLCFSFESVYEPYQSYSFDTIDGIDLVIKDLDGRFLSPLEVKLTVLPDNTTYKRAEENWGAELVVRSATTSYCALGMFDAVKSHASDVRSIFEEACSAIRGWDNDFEMTHKTPTLCNCIDSFQSKYYMNQKPLLMQTLWKTQGKSPLLAEQAFDLVVWSDYAFSRLFIDGSYETANTMSRPMRATARLARCLWELSKSGKIRVMDIYRQMAFGNQTDKEFSVPGSKWRTYVKTPRTASPILPKSAVHSIIEKGYIEKLSPERRFDQTLYFTVRS